MKHSGSIQERINKRQTKGQKDEWAIAADGDSTDYSRDQQPRKEQYSIGLLN